MISLFEHAAKRVGGEMPVDLITRDVRGVSLLEFLAHSEVAADQQEMTVEAAAEGEASERARQIRAMIQAAREEAAAEARCEFKAEMEGMLRQERERVDRICPEFARDRERYFAAAETQVVKLAMATARKVLAREVAADAMHLTATVRAALTRVRGRIGDRIEGAGAGCGELAKLVCERCGRGSGR